MTDNASSHFSVTSKLQSTLEDSGIAWPALRDHISSMAHGIQLAFGAFMSSLGVTSCYKSWEAHERYQQFGENESTVIGKSQRLRKEGTATINKVSAMRPGLAKIIEKVCILKYLKVLTLTFILPRMLTVLMTLTPGRRNESIDSQNAKVHIAVVPIMDVKTHWNSTLALLKWVYQLCEFTSKWLRNPKCRDYRPLSTSQDEFTIAKCVIEVLRRFRYWTLWMSKRHTVALHHLITVHDDMFHHMDDFMRPLARKMTQWKLHLFIAVKLAWQTLSKYHAAVTPETGMLFMSAHIVDPFRKLRWFRKGAKRMVIDPEDETSYTTQYQEAFLKYVENE